MLAKIVRSLLLCGAAGGMGLMAGCSTPCDAPGRLCAPVSTNTSTSAMLPPVPQALPPRPVEAPPPEAETFAVILPGSSTNSTSSTSDPTGTNAAPRAGIEPEGSRTVAPDPALQPQAANQPGAAPVRIGLLLPLRSEALGQAAGAVRAGFMAAWEHDRSGATVTVIETADVAQDVLSVYAGALQQQDIVVGPLTRSAVGAVAASPLVDKPTIALNYPDGYGTPGAAPLPDKLLVMGLSIEDEARQVAQWAAAEHPNSSALVLTTSTTWQHRIAVAFAAQWQRLGMAVKVIELSAPNGYLSDPELVQLRARLQSEQPGLLFSALGPDQTRQLRGALAGINGAQADAMVSVNGDAPPISLLPMYGSSALNAGALNNFPTQELDGVRLLDLPWQVQPDHPAVMVYPHPAQTDERKQATADMERLYALGIDAYRVAREIARHPASRFQLDGVTGKLNISFGQGASSFERVEQPAVYKNGVAQPLAVSR